MSDLENNKIPVFKSKFKGDGDHYIVGEDNKLHTVYVGECRPPENEYLTSIRGGRYFLIDRDRLLKRQTANGNIYYKVKVLD